MNLVPPESRSSIQQVALIGTVTGALLILAPAVLAIQLALRGESILSSFRLASIVFGAFLFFAVAAWYFYARIVRVALECTALLEDGALVLRWRLGLGSSRSRVKDAEQIHVLPGTIQLGSTWGEFREVRVGRSKFYVHQDFIESLMYSAQNAT